MTKDEIADIAKFKSFFLNKSSIQTAIGLLESGQYDELRAELHRLNMESIQLTAQYIKVFQYIIPKFVDPEFKCAKARNPLSIRAIEKI